MRGFPLQRFRTLWQLATYLGPLWLIRRAGYTLRKRAGLLRSSSPVSEWNDEPLTKFLKDSNLANPDHYAAHRRELASRFPFVQLKKEEWGDTFARWDSEVDSGLPSRVEALREGTMTWFGGVEMEVGFPPNWHRHPVTGETLPSRNHWSSIGEFGRGDIKLVWEMGRFGHVFDIARLYARTGETELAELFWTILEDWLEKNPPNRGPHWMCGQETSLRLLAVLFAVQVFLDDPATTAERFVKLGSFAAVSARRVESNLHYALSQQNNHGTSEALGLFLVGALFPEFRCSSRWRRKGRKWLERQARTLIYPDGSFSQHSANYHRVMLQSYLVAVRIAQLVDDPFSGTLIERITAAAGWIESLMDSQTGRLPRFGAYDGSLILPLSNMAHDDYRPVVQAAAMVLRGEPALPSGPWDEAALWLMGELPTEKSEQVSPADVSFPEGGLHLLRGESSHAVLRCGSFRHRPSHADLLHLDLWIDGVNLAIDPGTYSYNAPPPWDTPLAGSQLHNTPTLSGRDIMGKYSRFLWMPWAHGRLAAFSRSAEGLIAVMVGTHDGYRQQHIGGRASRAVIALPDDTWLVLDRVEGKGERQLHWLLPDGVAHLEEGDDLLHLEMAELKCHIATGASGGGRRELIHADDASPWGWQAPTYFKRSPANSLRVFAEEGTELLWTLFTRDPKARISHEEKRLTLSQKSFKAEVNLGSSPADVLCERVVLSGDHDDQWTREKR